MEKSISIKDKVRNMRMEALRKIPVHTLFTYKGDEILYGGWSWMNSNVNGGWLHVSFYRGAENIQARLNNEIANPSGMHAIFFLTNYTPV